MATVQTYKCPACDAGLKFNIGKQLWACDYCGNEYSLTDLQAQKAEVLTEETYEDNTPDVLLGNEYTESEVSAFSCPSCGGSIITDKNTSATFCPFCHNPTIIASRLDKQYRPVKLIPFKLQKDEVLTAMQKFCKRRPLLPKTFKHLIQMGEISGMYVPYWLFSADLDGALEGVGEVETRWVSGDYRYTKIDSYRVVRRGKLDFENLPADGSQKMDDTLMEGMEPYNCTEMTDFAVEYLSGHFAESYDVDSNAASVRAIQRMKDGISRALRGTVHGYTRFRTVRNDSRVLHSQHKYVLFPVWLLSVNYKGKTRMFAMNGQTGKVTGRLPLSIGRLFAWLGSFFTLSFIVTFLISYFIAH